MRIETPAGPTTDLSTIASLPDVPAPGESTETPSAPSVDVPARPSLDVALENLAHIADRVIPFAGRMRAWDLRALPGEMAIAFQGATDDLVNACARMNDQLMLMRAYGFVAKTTPITRLRAKLQVGQNVKLTEKARAEFAQVFSEEQLDALHVVTLRPQHAFLAAKDGTSLGLVKLSCIEAG